MKTFKPTLALLAALAATLAADAQSPADGKLFAPRQIKATMLKTARWQLANPKHEPTDWTNGAMWAGIHAAWQTTGSKELRRAMMEMGSQTAWQPGRRWYHADDVAICQTYIDLYRKEKRPEMIRPTTDTLAKYISLPYPVRDIQVVKWWWCDALFMAPPTLAKMAAVTGEERYMEACDKYFDECYDLLFDKDEILFARDLNYVIKGDGKDRREANGQKIFWSRGNGWVMGGLARMLEELPADYPKRAFYEDLFRRMAVRVASLQQADGLWRASLLDPESYPGGEVSGSGFFCYALAWGVTRGLLDRAEFLPVVKKAWVALNGCVSPEGRVGWVQPIGADPRKNFGSDSWEVYGTGAFLLAGSEVVKLKR
jgi:rhamnogalacturonyl hydrolase YesR